MDIRELQDKLIGVYDFTNALDCQAVISMLLKDLEIEKKTTQILSGELKTLATAVVDEKPEAISKATVITGGGSRTRSKVSVMGFLERMSLKMTEAESMTDEQLREALLQIWAEYDMDSKESSVLGEVLERLKK